MPFTLAAHAKINLRLEVFDVQPNGLHAIRSVVACLRVADELVFEASDGRLSVACEGLDLREEDNLVWKASRLLGVGEVLPGLRILVRKRIPAEAGLGGGSADAAAALRGALRALGTAQAGRDQLRTLAARLGSDVPGCLVDGLRVVEGTGEVVRPLLAAPPPWGVLLLKPATRVPTADAYRLLDEARAAGPARAQPDERLSSTADRLCDAYAAGDLARALPLLENDFQPVIEAAFPEIARARARLIEAGAAAALLCGSGACLAGLFETEAAAARGLRRARPGAREWSCVTGFFDAR